MRARRQSRSCLLLGSAWLVAVSPAVCSSIGAVVVGEGSFAIRNLPADTYTVCTSPPDGSMLLGFVQLAGSRQRL